MQNTPSKIVNLVFLERGEDEILLAMKKRGHGVGKWNGPGGKLEKGESIQDAAVREVMEEVRIKVNSLEKVGELYFYFQDDTECDMLTHIFRTCDFEGVASETEEMRPRWFSKSELPFDQMWDDDRYWIPEMLAGKKLNWSFWFDEEGKVVKQERHQ